MTSRTDTIAAVLRRPKLARPILAHELRQHVVQGLGPGTTAADWTATVPQLAEAIDTALQRQEQKDTRDGSRPPAGESTARAATRAGGHALVVEHDGRELIGSCQCGRRLGRLAPHRSVDQLAALWERHTTTEVPPLTSSIGAS